MLTEVSWRLWSYSNFSPMNCQQNLGVLRPLTLDTALSSSPHEMHPSSSPAPVTQMRTVPSQPAEDQGPQTTQPPTSLDQLDHHRTLSCWSQCISVSSVQLGPYQGISKADSRKASLFQLPLS